MNGKRRISHNHKAGWFTRGEFAKLAGRTVGWVMKLEERGKITATIIGEKKIHYFKPADVKALIAHEATMWVETKEDESKAAALVEMFVFHAIHPESTCVEALAEKFSMSVEAILYAHKKWAAQFKTVSPVPKLMTRAQLVLARNARNAEAEKEYAKRIRALEKDIPSSLRDYTKIPTPSRKERLARESERRASLAAFKSRL